MLTRRALLPVLVAASMAGCMQGERDAPFHAEQGWYEIGNRHFVLGIDGPFLIRDRDDALRSAYRVTYDVPGNLGASLRAYIDGHGRNVRSDGCYEETLNVCLSSVSWTSRGGPDTNGIGWPLLPRGQPLAMTNGESFVVQAKSSGEFLTVTLEGSDYSRVARYRAGQLMPVSIGPPDTGGTRTSWQQGELLGAAEIWPMDLAVAPIAPRDELFPGDETDPWNLGYSHRDVLDALLSNAEAKADWDAGCLHSYQTRRSQVNSGSILQDAPIAEHWVTLRSANGSVFLWRIDTSRDPLGALQWDITKEYAPWSSSSACPKTAQPGFNLALADFLERTERLRQPGGDDVLTVTHEVRNTCYRCNAFDQAFYAIHAEFPGRAGVLAATMDGNGWWVSMELSDGSEGIIDEDPPTP